MIFSSFSVTWSYYTKRHLYNYWFHIRIQIWENRTSSCMPRFEIMKISFSLPSLVSLPFSASFSPSSPLSPQPLPLTLSPFLSLSEVSVYSPGWYRIQELVVTLLIQSTGWDCKHTPLCYWPLEFTLNTSLIWLFSYVSISRKKGKAKEKLFLNKMVVNEFFWKIDNLYLIALSWG